MCSQFQGHHILYIASFKGHHYIASKGQYVTASDKGRHYVESFIGLSYEASFKGSHYIGRFRGQHNVMPVNFNHDLFVCDSKHSLKLPFVEINKFERQRKKLFEFLFTLPQFHLRCPRKIQLGRACSQSGDPSQG